VDTGILQEENTTVSDVGFATEQYIEEPLSDVRETKESPPEDPDERVVVAAVTVSDPPLV